jgi:hypothetical protein
LLLLEANLGIYHNVVLLLDLLLSIQKEEPAKGDLLFLIYCLNNRMEIRSGNIVLNIIGDNNIKANYMISHFTEKKHYNIPAP